MTETLRAVGVTAGYGTGRDALVDVAATLERGRVTALLGENGSGKSTLLRVLAGLLAPRSGRVLFFGRDLAAVSRRDRALAMGFLPQAFEPFFPATARALVLLGRTPRLGALGLPSAGDRDAVDAALAETDATALADEEIDAMSGGERQRVFLARVFAGAPEVLLLDEPTANLDPRHRYLVGAALRARAEAGATVVLSTHELDLAGAIADDAILLAAGRVAAAGACEDVLTAETLTRVYGVAACVAPGPGGRPVVTFASGGPPRPAESGSRPPR